MGFFVLHRTFWVFAELLVHGSFDVFAVIFHHHHGTTRFFRKMLKMTFCRVFSLFVTSWSHFSTEIHGRGSVSDPIFGPFLGSFRGPFLGPSGEVIGGYGALSRRRCQKGGPKSDQKRGHF